MLPGHDAGERWADERRQTKVRAPPSQPAQSASRPKEEEPAEHSKLGAPSPLLFSGPPSPQTYLDVHLFELRGVLLLDLDNKTPTGGGLVSALSDVLGLEASSGAAASGQFTAAACGGGGASGMDLLAVAVAGARNAVLLRGTRPVAVTARAPPPKHLLHALPWYDGSRSHVTYLQFTPPGGSDSLLACTSGGGLYVIRTAEALAPSGRRGAQDAFKPVVTLVTGGSPVVAVSWWVRAGDGVEFAIAAYQSGDVRFWDPLTGDALHTARVATCSSLTGAFIVAGSNTGGGVTIDLLLYGDVMAQRLGHTDEDVTSGGDADAAGAAGDTFSVLTPAAWALRLEDGREGATAFDASRPALFTPAPVVGRFGCGPPGVWPPPENAVLSAHCDGTLLVRLEPSTGLCQLYDVATSQHAHGEPPLEEHVLPLQTCSVCVTSRAIFAMHPAPARVRGDNYAGWCISVVARNLQQRGGAARRPSGGGEQTMDGTPSDGGTTPFSPAPACTVIQEMLLGPAFEDAFRAGGLMVCPQHGLAPGTGRTRPVVDGPFVWSPWALAHVIEGRAPPEAHFCALLDCSSSLLDAQFGGAISLPIYDTRLDDTASKELAHHSIQLPGDQRAALLGAGLGLNTRWLFTVVARDAAAAGDMARARQLFRTAGAAAPDVVAACLEEGRPEDALEELSHARPASSGVPPAATRVLRLACVTYTQLSAWAAAAAASALGSAPPDAAAAAAEAAQAAAGGAHRAVTPSVAAAAAAAVAQALQRGPGTGLDDVDEYELPVPDDTVAAVSSAAASACTAAAAAAAIASGVHDMALLGDRDGAWGDKVSDVHATNPWLDSAADANLRAEAMLRLMLACGRVAEALQSQGVALAEGTSGVTTPWLPPHTHSHVKAACPTLEDALLLRPGTAAHAVAASVGVGAGDSSSTAKAFSPPHIPKVCPSHAALAMLSDDSLLRAVAVAAPPNAGPAAVDVDSHLAALGALAARAPSRGNPSKAAPVQRALDAALGQHWARVRSPWVVATAMATAMDNVPACATVFNLAGDWERAALCRLAAFNTNALTSKPGTRGGAVGTGQTEEEATALVSVLASSLAAAASPDARWRVVLHIMAAWHARRLPQVKLEAALLDVCAANEATAEAVSRLILPSATDVADAAPTALPFRLSGRFALRLAALRVDAARRSAAALRPMTVQALWAQVERNLTARADAPSLARVMWPPDAEGSGVDAQAGGSPQEVVVFSCGHSATPVQMEDTLLPRLTTRLQGLGMGLSAQMVGHEYECGRMALACPTCVLSAVEAMVAANLR
jgi:hypothetical protein